MKSHEYFMKLALEEAKKAFSEGEVPVGAVVVHENKVISIGRNQRETKKNALSHAEIEVINQACKNLQRWRLLDCSIYVTLEPCAMCAGAIINARIPKLIFGAFEPRTGSCISTSNIYDLPFGDNIEVVSEVLEDECGKLIKDFFVQRRQALNSKNFEK